MRFLGTLMLLACVGMLLIPVYWEGRRHAKPGAEQPQPAITGHSTLSADDLLPRWRGPRKRGDEDG